MLLYVKPITRPRALRHEPKFPDDNVATILRNGAEVALTSCLESIQKE